MNSSKIVRLRTAIRTTKPLSKRALLRHRYSRALREAGQQKEAIWQERLALIERCFSRGAETGSLKKRVWLAMAYSGIRTHPLARHLALFRYRLAVTLSPRR